MKKYRYSIALFLITTLFSGCKFEREIDTSNLNINVTPSVVADNITSTPSEDENLPTIPVTENPVTIVVEDGKSMDEDAIVDFFFHQSKETLIEDEFLVEDYGIDIGLNEYMGFYCIKDEIEMYYNASYIDLTGKKHRESLLLYDMQNDAGMIYYNLLGNGSKYRNNEISNRLKQIYPEGELESCSREEVLQACAPLAKACGYEDAKVAVYAMTEECLEKQAYNDIDDTMDTAPGPDCENNVYEWTKEHEAYFVVYNSVLNGRVLDTVHYDLMCIYVPAYEKVVCVHAEQTLVVTETMPEAELITAEDAVANMIRDRNFESAEDISVTGISMVYSPQYKKVGEDLEQKTIDPCWRIDYELSEEMKNLSGFLDDDLTVMINAVDGKIATYYAN